MVWPGLPCAELKPSIVYLQKSNYCMAPLFTTTGRIRRKDFWIANLVLWFGFSILYMLVLALGIGGMASGDGAGIAMGIGMIAIIGMLSLPVAIASLTLSVRRWHDLNKSGWMVLLSFIPLVNIYAFIMTGFVEGTVGPNQYGEDPKAGERQGMPVAPAF